MTASPSPGTDLGSYRVSFCDSINCVTGIEVLPPRLPVCAALEICDHCPALRTPKYLPSENLALCADLWGKIRVSPELKNTYNAVGVAVRSTASALKSIFGKAQKDGMHLQLNEVVGAPLRNDECKTSPFRHSMEELVFISRGTKADKIFEVKAKVHQPSDKEHNMSSKQYDWDAKGDTFDQCSVKKQTLSLKLNSHGISRLTFHSYQDGSSAAPFDFTVLPAESAKKSLKSVLKSSARLFKPHTAIMPYFTVCSRSFCDTGKDTRLRMARKRQPEVPLPVRAEAVDRSLISLTELARAQAAGKAEEGKEKSGDEEEEDDENQDDDETE